ncbi:MAG TPA: hypothetical protein EYN67_04100 [Flavobacteriales bacterium]|jgi:hypothetical protein|nr:hypothetical protein [Flavobacteriales bacterium]
MGNYSTLKWFDYLRDDNVIAESVDPNYLHRAYEIELLCRISKTIGGNREETEEDIRGIPRITIVRSPTDAARRISRETEQYYFTNYLVKFQLNSLISSGWYLKHRLLPELAKIKGLNLIKYSRPYEVARGEK